MARQSAERKFLVISSVLIALLGVKTFLSIIEEPEFVENIRKPAAIAAKATKIQATEVLQNANQWVNLNFNCKKENEKRVRRKRKLPANPRKGLRERIQRSDLYC